VEERPDLIGLPDPLIFEAGVAEGRAVVTIDAKGSRQRAAAGARRGSASRGLVLVPPGRFPYPEKSGAVMLALDQLLRDLPGDDDLVIQRGGEHWLERAGSSSPH